MAGKVNSLNAATAGSVVFITVDGPWDVNWVEGPPTSADLIE